MTFADAFLRRLYGPPKAREGIEHVAMTCRRPWSPQYVAYAVFTDCELDEWRDNANDWSPGPPDPYVARVARLEYQVQALQWGTWSHAG